MADPKKIFLRYQGASPHRYKQNPLERRFAQEWQKANKQPNECAGGAHSTLAYLMDRDNRGNPDPPLTDRDWKIAATVVQWLGSPVGQVFLRTALSSKEAKHWRESFLENDAG